MDNTYDYNLVYHISILEKIFRKAVRNQMTLQEKIEQLFAKSEFDASDHETFNDFKTALREGAIRSAEKDENGNWHANAWVKQGILVGFKMGEMVTMSFRRFSFLIKTLIRYDR